MSTKSSCCKKGQNNLRFFISLDVNVNAALFAASCLCEFSKDFSSIVLEKAIRMVNAMKTVPEIKAGAVRLFARMGHSPTLAHAAQEAGKVLMLKLPTDEIVTSTLLSLSKLAFGSVVTLADQVDLLSSYLSSDPRCIVRAMSLKCINKLSAKASRCMPFQGKVFTTLLTILKDISLPTSLHCHALQILSKLCGHYVICVDACQLLELVSLTEISCLHPDWSKRKAALLLLVDLTCNIERLRKGIWNEIPRHQSAIDVLPEDSCRNTNAARKEDSQMELPVRATLLIFDQIALAFKCPTERVFSVEGAKQSSLVFSKRLATLTDVSYFLFSLILNLIEECHTVCLTVIDCIKGMLEVVLKRECLHVYKGIQNAEEDFQLGMCIDAELPQCVESRLDHCESNKQGSHVSGLMASLCHCLWVCLDKLDVVGGLDTRVYTKVKQITEYVVQLDSSSDLLYYLIPALLKSCRACRFGLLHGSKVINDRDMEINFCLFQDHFWAQHENLTLDVANGMMKERNFWGAYKIGIRAACHGAWAAASCIFKHLVNNVQSEASYFWLKSVALSAEAENKLHGVLIKSHGLDSLSECNYDNIKHDPNNTDDKLYNSGIFDVLTRYGEIMDEALNLNHAATNSLSSAVNLDRTFKFQRWFLNLRGKLIKNVAELLGLLNRHSHTIENRMDQEESDPNIEGSLCNGWKWKIQRLHSLKAALLHISLGFRTLTREFDLLNTSFMDIDSKSFSSISSVALCCSLLSFCTLFVVCFQKLAYGQHKPNKESSDFETQLYAAVIRDLTQRLWKMDGKIWEELESVSGDIGDVTNCSVVMTWMSGSGHQERAILKLCTLAISGVLKLQKQAKMMKHEVEQHKIWESGVRLLGNVTLKWFHLPSLFPKYFFRTRIPIGVELFAANMDKNELNGISVQQGFQLPLSLCIQVKNILSTSSLKVRRICCIFSVQPSDDSCGGTAEEYYAGWRLGWSGEEMEEILSLTEELFVKMRLMRSGTKPANFEPDRCKFRDTNVENTLQTKQAFVTFEVDKRGQGFAMCLLDVSSLPCGLYKTSWLCACLDNRGRFWNLQPLNAGPVFSIKP